MTSSSDEVPKYIKPVAPPNSKNEDKSIFAINESERSIKISFVIMCALILVLLLTIIWILISKFILSQVKSSSSAST